MVIVSVGDGDGVPLLLNVPECEEVAVFVGDILLVAVQVSEDVRDGVKVPV